MDEPAERVDYLLRIVDAQDESLDSPGEAFHTLLQAFSVDASRDDVFDRLKGLAERLTLWAELVAHVDEVVK